MSNDNATDDQTPVEGDNLKLLREAADRAKAVPGLERELAFAKAGIDTDTKLGKMLLATYDGELTKEAITAEATDIGLIKPAGSEQAPPPNPEEAARLAEQQRQQQMQQQMQGGQPAGAEPPPEGDPYETALGNFHKDRKNGMTEENAGLAAIDRILDQAGQGNKAVLLR